MNKQLKLIATFGSLFVLSTLVSNKIFAQTTANGIFFQAIARDNFSNPAKDRKIYIESSIIQYTATGTKVLIEQHEATTDETGVFNISLGNGKRIGGSATNLTYIDWAMGPYYLSLKIAITPRAPIPNWDYTKEWIDLGTTPFGTVPYALYAGSALGLNDKLSISDTTSMLAIYAKAQVLKALETTVSSKIASTDTAAMLAPYKKMVNEIIASNITSLTAGAINTALNSKVNVADSTTKYVTPTQLAAKTIDLTPITNAISLKANKVDVDSTLITKVSLADSTTLYVTPTQLSAKTFDLAPINTSIATKVDKVIGKGLSSNDFTTAEKTKLGAIYGTNTGDQDLSLLATTASLVLKANTSDVTTGLALKENISNKSTAVDLGGISPSDVLFPTQKAVKDYVAANNAGGGVADGGITTIKIADAAVTDAKINTVSGSKVIGNIVGSAATASLAGNITATTNTTLTSLSSLATVGTITSGVWSGTAVAVEKGGTGATTASAARTNLGLVVGSDVLANRTFGTAANNNTADFEVPLTFTSPLSRVTNTISIPAATTSVNGYLSSTDWTTFNAKQTALTAGSGISISAGTISATGLTTSNLSSTAGITNAQLAGSIAASKLVGTDITTVGTLIAGAVPYSLLTGTVPTFNQNTTGNAATATTATTAGTATTTIGNAGTATKLATARTINGVAFDGSADITITSSADAGTLTGTTLKSTITGSSLATVGTITSGVWSGTAVAVEKGGTGLTSAGTNGQVLSTTGSGTLTWTTPSTTATAYSGTLPVANGGTGAATLTANNVLLGNGTSALQAVAPGTTGNILTSNGTTWISAAASGGGGTHTIGESYGGGKVFYVTTDGLHGLIAETQDQSLSSNWYGAQNNISISGNHSAAGKLFTDWRLPTRDELNLLYSKKVTVGGFASINYWSSTEADYVNAWSQNFNGGGQGYYFKGDAVYVRAIRAF